MTRCTNISLFFPSLLLSSLSSPASLSLQEIQQLRQEIEAQTEIITIMGDALKENERRHENCPAMEKQLYVNPDCNHINIALALAKEESKPISALFGHLVKRTETRHAALVM